MILVRYHDVQNKTSHQSVEIVMASSYVTIHSFAFPLMCIKFILFLQQLY
jgi:hypothetical protein